MFWEHTSQIISNTPLPPKKMNNTPEIKKNATPIIVNGKECIPLESIEHQLTGYYALASLHLVHSGGYPSATKMLKAVLEIMEDTRQFGKSFKKDFCAEVRSYLSDKSNTLPTSCTATKEICE